MKKLLLLGLLSSTLIQSAFSMPDPIIPKFKSADLVPVSITILHQGSGEFPTARGIIKMQNTGNTQVNYAGPDTAIPNPFGSTPPTYVPRTLYRIGSVMVNNDQSNFTIAPNEIKEVEFYSLQLGNQLPKHCSIVELAIDTQRKFKQFLTLTTAGNTPYTNDVKKVFVRHAWNNKPCFTPINHLTGLPNL